MTGSSRRPISVEKPGTATGEPRWDRRNRTKMSENRTQDGRVKCKFEKNGGFAAFLAAKPSILLWNSVLGLKVNHQW